MRMSIRIICEYNLKTGCMVTVKDYFPQCKKPHTLAYKNASSTGALLVNIVSMNACWNAVIKTINEYVSFQNMVKVSKTWEKGISSLGSDSNQWGRAGWGAEYTILGFNISSNEKLDHSCKCTLWIMMYYRKWWVMFDFFTGICHTNSYDDNLIMWNIGDYSGTCWEKAFHKHNFWNKSSASDPETSW